MGRALLIFATGATENAAKQATTIVLLGLGAAGAAYYLYTQRAKLASTARAISQAPANAITSATRSYDKTEHGYQHRVGSESWFRNLIAPETKPTGGQWVPLAPEQIIVPNDPDVPTLTERWVPNVNPTAVYEDNRTWLQKILHPTDLSP